MNGKNRWMLWLVGALFAIITATSYRVSGKVDDLSERTRANEVRYEEILRRLTRIEDKLD